MGRRESSWDALPDAPVLEIIPQFPRDVVFQSQAPRALQNAYGGELCCQGRGVTVVLDVTPLFRVTSTRTSS